MDEQRARTHQDTLPAQSRRTPVTQHVQVAGLGGELRNTALPTRGSQRYPSYRPSSYTLHACVATVRPNRLWTSSCAVMCARAHTPLLWLSASHAPCAPRPHGARGRMRHSRDDYRGPRHLPDSGRPSPVPAWTIPGWAQCATTTVELELEHGAYEGRAPLVSLRVPQAAG